jgi:2-methylisocitrate lyase-like PEP mutase family enzyme
MNATKKRSELKSRLRQQGLISAPGVFDLISTKLAQREAFDVFYMTGYGTVASYLGLPDAGLATFTEMVNRVEAIANVLDRPLIADGDTGYGGLLNVAHTIRGYERAGAAAIQLEDQEFPKKCGHTPGRRVIPLSDMVSKIRVATEARRDPNFHIIARTDARTNYGLDEAIRRGHAYREAGADILFIESPETEDEMQKICDEFKGIPLVANMVEGGRTPILSKSRLEELGYRLAIFPTCGFLSAAAAMRDVYKTLHAEGSTDSFQGDLYNFTEFSMLMGFDSVWEFEDRHASLASERFAGEKSNA